MEAIATKHHTLRIVATIEEQQLVKLSLSGDQRAQYALYRKYVKAMYHMVLRMVGKQHEAEDVTQEVFSKIFAHLDSFKGESTLGAWIKKNNHKHHPVITFEKKGKSDGSPLKKVRY